MGHQTSQWGHEEGVSQDKWGVPEDDPPPLDVDVRQYCHYGWVSRFVPLKTVACEKGNFKISSYCSIKIFCLKDIIALYFVFFNSAHLFSTASWSNTF